MANPNILALVGAVAIAAVVAAATEAAYRQTGKSYNQCQREARSLGWRAGDESDQWGFDSYMLRCQHGADAQVDHRRAAREDRRDVRRPQTNGRALAQAEPKYQPYGVHSWEWCRDFATIRGVRFGDEEDGANGFMGSCMSGRVPR